MLKIGNISINIKKILLWIFLLLLFLFIFLFIALQTSFVQTKLTKYFTQKFSEKLNTELYIRNVKFSLLDGIRIYGFYIEDEQKDTLAYIGRTTVKFKNISFSDNNYKLKIIELDSLKFNYYGISENRSNLDFILEAFKSDTTNKDTTSKFSFSCSIVKLRYSNIKYRTFNPQETEGMNFEDINLSNINIRVHNVLYEDDNLEAKIIDFALKDKCGFELNNLSVDTIKYSSKYIETKNLRILTGNSDLKLHKLKFSYNDIKAFQDFINDVKLEADFDSSGVFVFNDLGYFSQELKGINEKFIFKGKVEGIISDFKTDNLLVQAGSFLSLNITSSIKNVTDIDNLKFDVSISNLDANLKELKTIILPGDTIPMLSLPAELENINNINYYGRTKGSIYNFVSNGKLKSNLGNITIDIEASRDTASIINIIGKFKGENLNIASVLNNKDVGKLTFNQTIKFSYLNNKKIKLTTEGRIDSVKYNGFTYRNIALYADMYDKNIDSINVNINQPGLKAAFSGKINLMNKKPDIKFSFKVDTANLRLLNIEKNTRKSFLSFELDADFKGLTMDDFQGQLKLVKNLKYQNDSINLRLKQFNLISSFDYQNGKEIKNITLTSDLVDVNIINTSSFEGLNIKVQNFLNNYFPAFFTTVAEDENVVYENFEYLKLKAVIKKPQIITNIFSPKTKIAQNTIVNLYYNYLNDSLYSTIVSRDIVYDKIDIQNFYSVIYTADSTLHTSIGGSSASYNESYLLKNIDITLQSLSDSSNFDLSWNNHEDSARFSGEITGAFNIKKNNNKKLFETIINKSELIISDTVWSLSESKILIDTTSIYVDRLTIKHDNQRIFVDGFISEGGGDLLYVKIRDFNLSNFNILTGESLNLQGKLSGTTRLVRLYDSPIVMSNDTIMSLEVNDVELGNLYLKSDWDNENEKVIAHLYNKKVNRRGKELMKDSIVGSYWPSKDSLSFTINISEILVKTFDQYYKDFIQFNSNSRLSGDININGYTSNLMYNGNLMLTRTGVKILYLNTSYTIDGQMDVTFDNSLLEIKPTKLNSARSGGKGVLKGNIYHNNFSNINMDLDLNVKNFQILNTTVTDSSYFYGTAYATGGINILGSLDDLNIDINLKTDKNTNFFIPLESSEILSEDNEFIKFKKDTIINPFVDDDEQEYDTDLSGMTLNMTLEVTPDASIQMIMDQSSGDIIKAKGRGSLKIDLDTRGDFNIFGDFNIVEGDYLFTLGSVISKHFLIGKGGKISWNGDPFNADISLDAVYVLKKVNLYGLLLEDIYQGVKTEAKCNIEMSGKLMNPSITFGVVLPEADEPTAQKLDNLGQEDINKQFLSLLIIGGFQPLPGLSQEAVGGTPMNTGEIITNQLNRWLSDISDEFDVGVNYQVGDQVTGDELEVALSTQLWDDRITINGNVGVGGAMKDESASNTSSFVGEVEAEVKLNKQGSLKMKVFNKANDDLVTDKGPYTQGIGFFWRREFNFLNLWRKNKKLEKDSTKIQQK